MIHTLAIANYRSLRHVVLPLNQLTVITGANGSGKSNLYRALRLLSETAMGGAVSSLAREGGINSAIWAGPETFSRAAIRQSREGHAITPSISSWDSKVTRSVTPLNLAYPHLLTAPLPMTRKSSVKSSGIVATFATLQRLPIAKTPWSVYATMTANGEQ